MRTLRLIQGTEGATKLDLFNTGGTLQKLKVKENHTLSQETQEEDDIAIAIHTVRGRRMSNSRTVNQSTRLIMVANMY